jgi:plasmid stability protein
MAVSFSIKNIPDHLAEKIRQRAAMNHRSLQGELLAILNESVKEEKVLQPSDVLSELERIGLKTPKEAVRFVREDRNARSNR